MKAAFARSYGPARVIEVGELPDPEPMPGQVVVRVHAASLNPIDHKLRSGNLRPLLRLRFPAVLGFDLAGEIVQIGSGATTWEIGDPVYGRIESKTGGAHAELAAVDAGVLDRIPDRLSFTEAAALPLTGMTAVQALRKARLRPGRRLLVNGAGGGVGSLAVQVGSAWGAEVVGVCRQEDDDLVRTLGAVATLDYTSGDVERATDQFDVILDTVFNRPSRELTRLLARGGTYVSTGFSLILAVRSVLGRLGFGPRMEYVVSRADGDLMRELSLLVDTADLTPIIDSTFPLESIGEAYERLEHDHTQGKVVIVLRA